MYLFDIGDFVIHLFGQIVVHFLFAVDLFNIFAHAVDHAHHCLHLYRKGFQHFLIH